MAALKNSSPKMCGYYSITSEREYNETASSLRYLKRPTNFPINLNKGLETIKYKPDTYFTEKMDSILQYIVNNKINFVYPDKLNSLIPCTKYITYRGVIRIIMCSPYENQNGWCILATKYKNNIYLSQLKTPEQLEALKNEPFWVKKFAYYGSKFEQCCLSEDPTLMPDTSQQIDACMQFFAVFKRMLVGRDFLFAGEMDGVVSEKPVDLNKLEDLNDLKFVELKVTADPKYSRYGPQNFKTKIQRVWTQSFLTGVEDIYFGMRDRDGIVNKIEYYTNEHLRRIGERDWQPAKCFTFLDKFLTTVETTMAKIDCPHTVCEFNFNEKTKNITYEMHPGKTELSLLPDWYLEAVNN